MLWAWTQRASWNGIYSHFTKQLWVPALAISFARSRNREINRGRSTFTYKPIWYVSIKEIFGLWLWHYRFIVYLYTILGTKRGKCEQRIHIGLLGLWMWTQTIRQKPSYPMNGRFIHMNRGVDVAWMGRMVSGHSVIPINTLEHRKVFIDKLRLGLTVFVLEAFWPLRYAFTHLGLEDIFVFILIIYSTKTLTRRSAVGGKHKLGTYGNQDVMPVRDSLSQ